MTKKCIKKLKISVIGLGYVGLPIAIAFAKNDMQVVGFDSNEEKIELYRNGIDPTNEVGNVNVGNAVNIKFTSDPKDLEECDFHIVSVPTPVNADHTPNLSPIITASETLGQHLKSGSIVVYESTVYPGVTEDICLPILEKNSGLTCGADFKIGYSPERINPGDKKHRLESIVKIVSGMDEETLDTIAAAYSVVVKAGVYKAPSIKIAEAAKVIENSQRDINIAFMNELALIFDKMNIDTSEVIKAAQTKWNFLNFTPGLVGGHCIGVDPYYLTYKATQIGYTPEVILAGRRINDSMGKYVAEKVVKKLIEADVPIKGAKTAILGLTFKENCPDIRNSKVFDIIKELREYEIEVVAVDPWADKNEVRREYGIESFGELNQSVNAVVIAVAHEEFRRLSIETIGRYFSEGQENKVLIDVKGIVDQGALTSNFKYWRL